MSPGLLLTSPQSDESKPAKDVNRRVGWEHVESVSQEKDGEEVLNAVAFKYPSWIDY